MNLNEEISRINNIIFGKIIKEQSESCPTLDDIMRGEVDTKNPERYRYYQNTLIKKIAETGWGVGTNEDDAIKVLNNEIKNYDDLVDFSNAWKNYIKEATDTANIWSWQNELFNWLFNYETFFSYIKEEDDGNDIMSEMRPKWEQWISDICNKTYDETTLSGKEYYIQDMSLTVKNVKQVSKGQVVKTFDVTKLETEYNKGHGKFMWNIDFEITPSDKYSMQSIKIIDNYTKKELFNCSEPTCQLPVELGKKFVNSFDWIQMGDFVKPWFSAKVEFNNGEIKEYVFDSIEYIQSSPTTTVKKECDTKNFTFQKSNRLLKIIIPKCNTKKKVSKLELFYGDGKLISSVNNLNEIFLPYQAKGLYFLSIIFSDNKKNLVKILQTENNENTTTNYNFN